MNRKDTRPAGSRSDREHFAGHRRGSRLRCVMPVECAGATGKYKARTIELSRSGALVEIRDPDFRDGDPKSSLLTFSARVMSEFAGGMRIRFFAPKVSLAARVIRTTRHPTAASLLIGCEFLTELTEQRCRMLGLPTGDSPTA